MPKLSARPLLLLALLFAALAVPAAAAAQTDTTAVVQDTIYEVRLTDGSVLYGRITAQSEHQVTLLTQAGSAVQLERAHIQTMQPFRGRIVQGQVWGEDPHATRLFFAPTGRAMRRGEAYLGVYELFFPFVSYGVTDRFTISAGTPIVPEAIAKLFYIAPKLEVVRTPALSASVGVLALFATEELTGSAGLVYGVGTFGSPDGALTVGAAVPFIATEGESDVDDRPVFMIGGESRLTRRTKLISENYFYPTASGGLVSAGVRFFGQQLSADFGIGAAVGQDGSGCCLPLVNFVYSF